MKGIKKHDYGESIWGQGGKAGEVGGVGSVLAFCLSQGFLMKENI